MAPISDDTTRGTQDALSGGAGDYLADMILEVQQTALRLGAGQVSNHLQLAYLELQAMRQTNGQFDTARPLRQVARK